MKSSNQSCSSDCVKRRGFLQTTAASVTMMLLADVFPGRVSAQDAGTEVPVVELSRQRIAKLSDLTKDVPIEFNYPSRALHTNCILYKLGTEAGGGVGPDADVVAFSARCTHMGGDLSQGYIAEHKLVGCGEHLTTFDLTRHGIMVAGHATERLPQIILELDGDEIFATGIVGLFYGYHQNPTAENN
ncbi:arsenate reductase (azurin) small subunit [Planctomycetes bacterium K23_9]|uniref:Arsenite oxidase subunit AioB n=1 Tax=Stieleria marina TaxID=1930275 RepID=A0A517NYM2_9BACT|nr:Arsenite oxidase subunit AioB precursor [Planctomycetes bacterium K23_9]